MTSKPRQSQPRIKSVLSGMRVPIPGFLRRLFRGRTQASHTRLMLALTFIFLFVAAATMNLIDGEETTQLAWALLLLIAVSSLVRVIPGSGAVAVLLCIGTYGGIQLMRTIKGGNYFPQIFAGMACFALVAWVTRATAQRLEAVEEEIENKSILLDEVTMRDSVTGALKRQHAHRLLTEEIMRSRRYAHSLTLLIVGIDAWETIAEERAPQEVRELLTKMAGIMANSVRLNIDVVSRHDHSRFVAILPETPLEGARVVAERIVTSVRQETGLNARVGIAEFPADAVTPDELVAEAEEALEFAGAAELRIADRKILT